MSAKYIPILFSTPMVEAILLGKKTQTRRVVKPQPLNGYDRVHQETAVHFQWENDEQPLGMFTVKCPYGKPGDILWVRETWCLTQPKNPEDYYFGYKKGDPSLHKASEKYDYSSPDKWRPSIHMPKEAARLFLRVKSVRVERLWSITESDAVAEGVTPDDFDLGTAQMVRPILKKGEPTGDAGISFMNLWGRINGKDSWDANPWVWVIEFERIPQPSKWPL